MRPDSDTLAEYEALFSQAAPPAVVSRSWLQARVLVCGRLQILYGEVIAVEDLSLRQKLHRRHLRLLREHEHPFLDISVLRGPNRKVTQAIARDLYEEGMAGLIYGSNIDGGCCVVVFEGRARLEQVGRPVALESGSPDLLRVLAELGLTLSA